MKFVELSSSGIDRRDFLAAGGTASAFMALFRAMEARAQEAPEGLRADATPPIKCGVIGCGPRGREVISTLALLPSAPLVAVCEHYPALLTRAQRSAPNAKAYATHAELLARVPVRVRVDAADSAGPVPAVPVAATRVDAATADPIPSTVCEKLAADAAQTTLMVVAFQRWYREQRDANANP